MKLYCCATQHVQQLSTRREEVIVSDHATVAFFQQLHRNAVDMINLLAVLGKWGPCAAHRSEYLPDVSPHRTGEGAVDAGDLLLVISNLG